MTGEATSWILDTWQWEAVLRMLVAVAVGGIVGLEREYHGRPAGFRTHLLVCLGCCIIMLVSIHFERMYTYLTQESVVRLDPARVAYGVVTGIGFLGAGVIMKSNGSIHGLTTAACLWTVAALGLAVGVGMYVIVAFGTIFTLLALVGMRQIGESMNSHFYRKVRVTLADTADPQRVVQRLEERGATILNSSIDHRRTEGMIIATYGLRFGGERTASEVLDMVKDVGEFDRVEVE